VSVGSAAGMIVLMLTGREPLSRDLYNGNAEGAFKVQGSMFKVSSRDCEDGTKGFHPESHSRYSNPANRFL